TLKDEYGYKTFPNVMTSIEFERILSASGPTGGHISRPSDGKEPKKIAFIQCIGSRDMQLGNEYCSAICCMQAAKDSVIVKEHLTEVESTIFCMDIRTYGKDFDRFINKAKDVYKTRIIYGRISSIEVDPQTEDLVIPYNTDDGKIVKETFNLVVLSVGLTVSESIRQLTNKLGITLDECGFTKASAFSPVATSRPGVFVAGTLSGPKDIPETVMEASGSVSGASAMLVDFPVKEIKEDLPPEINITGIPPRLGVFICRCGINIGGIVDVPAVVEYASDLDNVVHAQEFIFSCSQDAQKVIDEVIREKELNRVVVAACTPRTHEPLFQKTLRGAGLNPYLFEFANIREQCSWVHQKDQELATAKAKDLVRMAVSKVRLYQSLEKTLLPINHDALVIGGGIAGMTAALDLADQGFKVSLVEREPELGGNTRHIHYTLNGEDVQHFLLSLIKKTKNHKNINLFLNTEIKDITGFIGNFKTSLNMGKGNGKEIEHGTVIVASGGSEYKPSEYLYGQNKSVRLQRELEEQIASNSISDEKVAALINSRQGGTIVMIQCVGFRDDERPYCSRICCSQAVKNALKLKELNPKLNIYILYRDIRTSGTRELYYRDAREKGIVFIRYEDEQKPEVVAKKGGLRVKVLDRILRRDILFDADLVVLNSGIVPNEDNKRLSQMLKVPLTEDRFFLEAHVKLRPVDFATDGIFVCGLAHYPKDISESITQARAAAARATVILTKEVFEAEGKVSFVRKERCSGCGLCVEVCAYQAIEIDEKEKVAVINDALCKGCGACASSCRGNALNLKGFQDDQIMEALKVVNT
ncbi:FAD-dependent oxidoreductase, partial [Candidatus Latescibacterota bacterium]